MGRDARKESEDRGSARSDRREARGCVASLPFFSLRFFGKKRSPAERPAERPRSARGAPAERRQRHKPRARRSQDPPKNGARAKHGGRTRRRTTEKPSEASAKKKNGRVSPQGNRIFCPFSRTEKGKNAHFFSGEGLHTTKARSGLSSLRFSRGNKAGRKTARGAQLVRRHG